MNYEISCGVVACRNEGGQLHYLLIRARNGEYGFPKGHMEPGETEHETAIRELKEETNAEVRLVDGFRRQIEYPLPRKRDTMKRSVYFLGECTSQALICQECEVADAMFLPLEKALELLTFEETKAILRDADAFLRR